MEQELLTIILGHISSATIESRVLNKALGNITKGPLKGYDFFSSNIKELVNQGVVEYETHQAVLDRNKRVIEKAYSTCEFTDLLSPKDLFERFMKIQQDDFGFVDKRNKFIKTKLEKVFTYNHKTRDFTNECVQDCLDYFKDNILELMITNSKIKSLDGKFISGSREDVIGLILNVNYLKREFISIFNKNLLKTNNKDTSISIAESVIKALIDNAAFGCTTVILVRAKYRLSLLAIRSKRRFRFTNRFVEKYNNMIRILNMILNDFNSGISINGIWYTPNFTPKQITKIIDIAQSTNRFSDFNYKNRSLTVLGKIIDEAVHHITNDVARKLLLHRIRDNFFVKEQRELHKKASEKVTPKHLGINVDKVLYTGPVNQNYISRRKYMIHMEKGYTCKINKYITNIYYIENDSLYDIEINDEMSFNIVIDQIQKEGIL